jgi:hypothetical protein
MLDARCSMLDARCSMLDARCSMLDARCYVRNARTRRFHAEPAEIAENGLVFLCGLGGLGVECLS